MTQQEANARFTEKMVNFQKETTFSESEELMELFPHYLKALRFYSPVSLGLSVSEFVASYANEFGEEAKANLYEAGIMLSVLEKATADQLELKMGHEYTAFITRVSVLAEAYRAIIEPKALAVNREIQALHRISVPGGSKSIVPLGKA